MFHIKKFAIVTICCLTNIILAKSNFRPPLIVENIVSNEVKVFLENSHSKNKKITRTSNFDLLGRKINDSTYATNYIIVPEETMEVDVVYLGAHKPSANISGRFEYQNGSYKYWFNGESVSEKEYFELFSKSLNKEFRNPGFRKKMSANEIEKLLRGPQKIFIEKAKSLSEEKNTDLNIRSYTDYNIILGLSEVSSHAHANGYKGNGIGVFLTNETVLIQRI